MALRDAWWMQDQLQLPQNTFGGHEYQEWPRNQSSDGIGFRILESVLRDRPGAACRIDVYGYTRGFQPTWCFLRTLDTAAQIVEMHRPWVCSLKCLENLHDTG